MDQIRNSGNTFFVVQLEKHLVLYAVLLQYFISNDFLDFSYLDSFLALTESHWCLDLIM